jgi:hypothetical protein
MNPENPLYSVSLGVASLQVDSVGVPTALSPVCVGHFKFYLSTSIGGLGLNPLDGATLERNVKDLFALDQTLIPKLREILK